MASLDQMGVDHVVRRGLDVPRSETGPGPWRSWITLLILSLLYVVAFVDRLILALLLDPLKHDLMLSDVQLGLLFGTAFSLFYAVTSVPLARLADVTNRKWVIIAGVSFWSLCTLLTALSTNYWMLSTLRFGLAIGEAALTPAALSLLSDLFPPRRRLIALTLFSATGMAGSSIAYLAGAGLIQFVNAVLAAGFAPGWQAWRFVFLVVGTPGLILSLALALIAREPERRGTDADAKPGLGEVMRHMSASGWLYFGLFAGAGFGLLSCQGVLAWGPTYVQRAYGVTAAGAGYGFGIAQVVAGGGGALVIPILVRKLAESRRLSAAATVPVCAALAGTLILAIAPMARSMVPFLVCYGIGGFLLIGLSNALSISIQYFAPARMRATLTALFLVCISAFGMGIGPVLTAALAKLAPGAAVPLGWGLVMNSAIGLVGCAIFFLLAWRRFRHALSMND